MKNKTTKYRQIFALLVLAFTTTFVSYANSDPQEGGIVDTKSEVEAYILHHIKDSHDFSLFLILTAKEKDTTLVFHCL